MDSTKNNKKKKVNMASAVVTAAVSFAVLFGNSTVDANSYVKQDGENGFTYYANGSKVASLVLENIDENTKKAIIFVRNNEGYFRVHSLSLISSKNEITITTNDDLSRTYYVAVTNNKDITLSQARKLYNDCTLESSDEENNIYKIKNDNATFEVEKVTVINDTTAPEIKDIKKSTEDYTFNAVTVTITAEDNLKDSTNILEYSSNGKTWSTDNTFTVASNGEYTFYVRDKSKNVSKEKTINISNIITNEEKYTVEKFVEHNENTTSGSSYWKYKVLVNGGEGAQYYYKNTNDNKSLKDIDINTVIWNTKPYSVEINKMKSYLGVFVKSINGTVNLQTVNMGENGEVALKINNYQKQEQTKEKYVANVKITTLKGNVPSNLQSNLKGEIENGNVSFSVDNETKLTTITVTPKDKNKSVQGDLNISYVNKLGVTEYFIVENVFVDSEAPTILPNGEYDSDTWRKNLYSVDIAVSDNLSEKIALEAQLVDASNGNLIKSDDLSISIKDTKTKNAEGKEIYTVEISGEYNQNLNALLQIKATDEYGNSFTYSCNYKVDFTNPTITKQNIAGLSDYIEKDKIYNVWASGVSDTGSGVAKVELICGEKSVELAKIRNGYYSAEVNLSEEFKDCLSLENTIDLSIRVTDNSGRTETNYIKSPKYYTSINKVSSSIVASGDNKYLNDGEDLILTYTFDHSVDLDKVFVNDELVNIDDEKSSLIEIAGNYQYIFVVPYDEIKSLIKDEENVSVKVQFSDKYGNTFEETKSNVKYYREFSLSETNLTSNNTTSAKAVKKGDKLTLTFTTDKAVTPKNSESVRASIGGKRVTVHTDDNIHWTAEYIVTGAESWTDTQSINAKLTIIDIADNKVTKELSETGISYYKPVSIAERSIKITAQNGTNMVINGEKVYITFATSHKVESVSAKIAEKELTAKSSDGINWTIEYTVDGADGLQDEKLLYYVNDKLNINITITDIAGNTYNAVKESFSNNDSEKVRYYAPISINDSIEVTPNSVKVDDSIRINFSTDDTVEIAKVTINGKEYEATATNTDKTSWQLIYTIPKDNNFEDLKEIPIKVYVKDKAGNEDTKEFIESGVIYYGELAINNVKIKSLNESNEKAVKTGDTIELTFDITKGHIVSTDKISVTIGGLNAAITAVEAENNKFKATVIIDDSLKDLSNIEYSISVEDSVENKANKSDTTDVKYYSSLNIIDNSITIVSNNKKDTSLATFGDTLTVEFSVNHEITENTILINGFEVLKSNITLIDINEAGQASYKAEFKIDSDFYTGDSDKDDFIIPIELSLVDKAGNTITSNDEDLSETLVSFGAKVSIKEVIVTSQNTNSSVVKANDNVKVDFVTDDDIENATIKLLIGGIVVASNDINTTNTNHTTTLTIPSFEELTALGVKDLTDISTIIDIEDKYGNTSNSENETAIKYYGEISIVDNKVTVVSNNISGITNISKNGDIITLSFATNHIVTDVDITIGGETFKAESIDGINWTASYTIPEDTFTDTKNIIISEILIADTANNEFTEKDITTEVTYYAPVEISNISVTTNNANDSTLYAKNGNVLTIKFDTNHNTKIDNVLVGNGSVLKDITSTSTMSSVNNGDGTVTWTVNYTITEETSLQDTQKITVSVAVSDIAKNENNINNESKVTYYAPIIINNVNITSNNESGNNAIAKDGDIITVTFGANHNVTVTSSMIAGNNADVSGSADSWILKHKLANGDVSADNSNIGAYITVIDVAGNTATYSKNTGSDTSNSVIYYKPIAQSISNISMSSNEIDTNLNNGDTIYWNFSTTHPINTSNTYIEVDGKKVNFVFVSNTEGKYNYQTSYVIPATNTLKDVEIINYNLYVNDSAKNSTYKNNQEQTIKFKYYAPIQITNIVINTNNSNNGTMYAKDGDTVTVSFTSNHAINLDTAKIAGVIADVSGNSTSGNYKFTYTIPKNTLKDLSVIPFTFLVSDAARNMSDTITNTSKDVKNSITYYAPITAKAEISANGSNSSFVSNSGIVKVSLETNHNTTISSGTVGGYSGVSNGSNTLKPFLTYTIPSNESKLSQGRLNFNCNVTDVAGNTLVVTNTQGSAVIYDRDNPLISIVPDLSSFVNQEVTYTVNISDANLEANYITISVTMDGKSTTYPVTYSDIVSNGGSTISKNITLSKDAEYVIEVTAKDKADNSATPKTVRVTVDTTNPVIDVVGIDLNTPKTYKEGQVLGDFFKVDEKNIKDIICTITDNKGNVQEWSLDKPITSDMDGRQTFTLLVTDLAGNTSNGITYDFYIDNTEPKFVILDDTTNTPLSSSNVETFISNMHLNISLENLNVGNKSLDRFTTAKLVKPDNTEINLLGSDATAAIVYDLNSATFEDGEYKLVLSAVDDMGNETGEVVYTFEFKDKSIFVKFFENKGLFYTSIAIAGVLIIAGIVIIIKKKKKGNN